MSKVEVQKVDSTDDRSLPVFAEFDRFMDSIRERAHELFCLRDREGSSEIEDWLTAEREFSWPAAELEEDSDEFEVKIALAGFEPEEISVTASPQELIVKARHEERNDRRDDSKVRWTEFRSNDVYRRIALPSEVDVNKIKAKIKRGLLEIDAPKAGDAGKTKGTGVKKKVRVSSAA